LLAQLNRLELICIEQAGRPRDYFRVLVQGLQRFLMNCVGDYLSMVFPPVLPSLQHIAINSLAARQLSGRVGVSAMIIPSVTM
jgi:hypothetical protein